MILSHKNRRLGAELNREIVSCRACVRAVCMSSEFGVKIYGPVLSYPAPAHQVCCYLGKNSGEGVSLKIGQRGDAPYPSWMASIEFRELEGGSPNTTTVLNMIFLRSISFQLSEQCTLFGTVGDIF